MKTLQLYLEFEVFLQCCVFISLLLLRYPAQQVVWKALMEWSVFLSTTVSKEVLAISIQCALEA